MLKFRLEYIFIIEEIKDISGFLHEHSSQIYTSFQSSELLD